VWGLCKVSTIESAHLFACKRILSVSDKTPNHMAYGETGRYPLFIESTISAVRYWFRLKTMHLSRFPKQIYNSMVNNLGTEDMKSGKNWARCIKDCLNSYGFLNVWTEGVVSEKAFLVNLKQAMIHRFKDEWRVKIFTSERSATYSLFKHVFETEIYLNDLTIKKFRDPMIRMRLGLNELGTNKRFQSGNCNKNCPFCITELEDELHVIFVCPTYNNIRSKYIPSLVSMDINPDICIAFLNPDVEFQRKLAMFIFYALKERYVITSNTGT
jgi:hypothetical protein